MSSISPERVYVTVEPPKSIVPTNGESHGLVWTDQPGSTARWRYKPDAAVPLMIGPVDSLAMPENQECYKPLRAPLLRYLAATGLEGGGGG
jgi:hypothetical protein